MLIDAHAHLVYEGLIDRIEEVLSNAAALGVGRVVSIGTDPANGAATLELCDRFEEVYAALGIHPHEADKYSDASGLREMLGHPKVLAVGETGLDYHYGFADRGNQRRLFESQLALAAETGLPMVLHCREGFPDALPMIRSAGKDLRGVFHCFTGTAAEADQVIAMGWSISFTGILTFKKSEELRRIAERIPIENVLVETDSPYLSPEPVRSVRPNEPAHVRYVAEYLAAVRGMTYDAVVERIWQNAVRLFGPGLCGHEAGWSGR